MGETFNEDDIKDMKDSMGTTSTEAPLSTNIVGYYKGFHVGITIRDDKNDSIPAGKIIKVIDSLLEKGFMPSWNEDTNKKTIQPTLPTPPVTKPCTHEGCQGTMVFKKGISKKNGKPWAGWFCDLVSDHKVWEN